MSGSNHRQLDCLVDSLYMLSAKETPKFRVIGSFVRKSTDPWGVIWETPPWRVFMTEPKGENYINPGYFTLAAIDLKP